MGKIYDALKKAEKEALDLKQKTKVHPLAGQHKHSPLKENKKLFPSELNERHFILDQPESLIAEQFKILRTRLFRLTKNKPLRTILVTSTFADEGKSTIASNLAMSIAQGFDEHVLLVDADLRKPSLANHFSIPPGDGLVNVLLHNRSLSEVLHKTSIDKLSIVTSGKIPDNPLALIASEKMKALIRDIKTDFKDHLVIIDSSPVQQTSEPRILAEEVDGILLVVQADKTSRELTKDTITTLGKEKILGIVFNRSKEKLHRRYKEYYSSKQI